MRSIPSGPGWAHALSQPRALGWLAAFIAAGCALYLGGMVWSGWGLVLAAFGRLGLEGFGIGIGVASTAYLVRFMRWHVALGQLGHRVPWRANLRIYLSGLALTTSPGKIGETFRSVLLLPFGVPASRSVGAFLADRLSDVVGVCLLGVLAALVRGTMPTGMLVALTAIVGGSFVFRRVVGQPAWWDVLGRQARWLRASGRLAHDVLLCWRQLWRPFNLFLFSGAAVLAYGLQAGVFAWFCRLLNIEIDAPLAIVIFVNATLLGAASMVPGGLGAMEAALVVQLVQHGADPSLAISAAIAIRFTTLWTGILIGLVCLLAGVPGRRREGLA